MVDIAIMTMDAAADDDDDAEDDDGDFDGHDDLDRGRSTSSGQDSLWGTVLSSFLPATAQSQENRTSGAHGMCHKGIAGFYLSSG